MPIVNVSRSEIAYFKSLHIITYPCKGERDGRPGNLHRNMLREQRINRCLVAIPSES